MPIDVTIHDDGKTFTLLETVEYEDNKNPGFRIVVPTYFRTDMASIPRIFWSIYPPTGRYQRAAIIHDWLYICHYSNRSPYLYSVPSTIRASLLSSLPTAPYTNRKACDDTFLEIMRLSGVSWRTRYTLYVAVRLFAGRLWKKGHYQVGGANV